jgi:predicted RNA-binding Zn-ribbon protein involved in translation (DUF1610 family)
MRRGKSLEEENMSIKKDLLAPCGLYCGVCGIHIAHRNQSDKLKEKLAALYGMKKEDIQCEGCLFNDRFSYCSACAIRSCATEKNYEGCHQCGDFPCSHISNFAFEDARNIMLKEIPRWREMGTAKWVEAQEAKYHCPNCGAPLFRGVTRCRECKAAVVID